MRKIDILTDIETLGREKECPIIQIAALAFDEYGIVGKFDCKTTLEDERVVSVNIETLKWWLSTNPKQLSDILTYNPQTPINNIGTSCCGNCFCTEELLLKAFSDWVKNLSTYPNQEDVYLWGNGILFDNKLLKDSMEKHNIEYPIHYRNNRDLRTLIEIAANMTGCESEKEFRQKFVDPNLVEHEAFNDVLNEYEAMKATFKIIYSKSKE